MPPVRRRVRTGGSFVDVDFIGFDQATDALKATRRDLTRELDEIAKRVADREVLPTAKRKASGLKVDGRSVAGSLVVRKRRIAPYMTTTLRGIRGRAVGLQEHGGIVKTPIFPRGTKLVARAGQRSKLEFTGRRRALAPAAGGGHPVAAVRSARHYRAIRFMQGAVDDRIDEYGRSLRDEIVGVFGRRMEVR